MRTTVEVVVGERELEVALRGEGESDGRGMRLKNPPGHQGVIYANGRIWDCPAGALSLPLSLSLSPPLLSSAPSPSPPPSASSFSSSSKSGEGGKRGREGGGHYE